MIIYRESSVSPRTIEPLVFGTRRFLSLTFAIVVLGVAMSACFGSGEEPDQSERMLKLEATVQALEGAVEALKTENAELKDEVASSKQEVGQSRGDSDLDDLESRLEQLEALWATKDTALTDKEQWSEDKSEWATEGDGDVADLTASIVEESGGQVHFVEHPARQDPAVLVMPQDAVDGETPLIVSLHGFGGNSADHAAYFPLHERVNTGGFALLLPNGNLNDEGYQFWNPTDDCCESAKSGGDDVGYLTELIENARKIGDFGSVYFFGYSNGGFMSYHMACKGLPGLRAVASLAGTSYVADSSCAGAPPVSVLHIHGTEDSVIQFVGDETEPDPKRDGETAFYASATEMLTRWSQRAGCNWHDGIQFYASFDFDQFVPGAETQAFHIGPDANCADGITIELWKGNGSTHGPAYSDTFINTLLDWILSQE